VTLVAVNTILFWIMTALQIFGIGLTVYALVHAVRQRGDAFTAVDKLTKPIWLAILLVSLLVILAMGVLGLLGFIAIIAVGIYLADVKPRVDDIQRGGSRW
jgi:hypothetical protein